MNKLWQDVRYGLRQLRKSPGFTLTAVITLALGIGANAAIFTLVQGILLRSLPFSDPTQLYRIGDKDDCCVEGGFVGDNGDFDIFSYDLYLQFKQSAPEFEQLAAMRAGFGGFSVRRGNAIAKELTGEQVSGNYFSTLGIGPFLGRVFTDNDDAPGAAPAVVLMTKSLNKLEHQNFGIVTENRYVAHFDPHGAGYSLDRLPALYREIQNRFGSLPGIAGVGLAMYSPLEGDNWGECVIQQGHAAPRPGDHCGSTWDRVSAGYLTVIGVPVLRGREFTDQDTATSQPVAIVNETFVKRFFPNQDPMGRHFGIDDVKYSGSWEIIGVFKDFKMNNPRQEPRPVFLRPMTQYYKPYVEASFISTEDQSMYANSIMLRFNRPQQDADSLIRRTLASIDPNLTINDLRSLDAQVAGNFDEDRLLARLTTLFGVLALILASVGLYGVTSYFVVRRTAEIGIRMALGSTRGGVVRLVLQSVAWQIGLGLALGIPSALIAGRYMKSQLYGVSGYDATAMISGVVVLCCCALVAGFIPARRAATIEPMRALRTE